MKAILSLQSLWLLRVWFASICLDLKVFSQKLQGIETPSKWFDSMWLFIFAMIFSFPHTLHRYIGCPCPFFAEVFSIIERHFWSSSCKTPEEEKWDVSATWAPKVSGVLLSICSPKYVWDGPIDFKALGSFLWTVLIFFGSVILKVSSWTTSSSSDFPINPLSWSSSAMARNESKFSWRHLPLHSRES